VAIYALLMQPEVQGKVDHIVGHDHPPRAEDRIRMAYLETVWKDPVRVESSSAAQCVMGILPAEFQAN
jgi:hypothetical protein